MEKPVATWLNKDSRTFLSRGYLKEGQTAEERISEIAQAAEKILKIDGYASKLEDGMLRGWASLASPVWTNFGHGKNLPISCNGSYFPDDTAEILRKTAEIGMMSKYGAGTSAFFGEVRSRGSDISTGGKSDGSVHFMEGVQAWVNIISQGAVRRGNCAIYLPIDHGDIKEFLNIRDEGHPIQKLSIGVTISDEWMESMIDGDKDKRKLWTRIIQKRFETGYPYVIFSDAMNIGRSKWYKDLDMKILASNLCFTGDTLVATADGRNAVRIEELDGTEFPVYSARRKLGGKKGWKTEIKKARAFKTGTKKVVTVRLNDGTEFRCTPEHMIALADGGYVKASESVGRELAGMFTTKTSNYRTINSFTNGYAYQHRMIWEYENGPKPDGFHIDHKISDGDDSINNLQLLKIEDHLEKTSIEVSGDNNAVFKIKDKDSWVRLHEITSFRENNSRWSGVTDEEIISAAFELYDSGIVINIDNLRKLNTRIPKSFSKNRFGGDVRNLRKIVSGEVEYIEPTAPEELIKDAVARSYSNPIVVEISDIGDFEDVYDLNVEDNHNFYILLSGDEKFQESHGVLVHNCTEIALPSSANESFVCDLSSLNLLHYDEWKDTDWVETMMLLLDAVMTDYIDKASKIPFMEDAVRFAKRHRALGLGVLGWHSFLQSKMIPFASIDAKKLNVEIWQNIRTKAEAASKMMAQLYGEPEIMQGYGYRNASWLAVAPTTSSSFILGQVSRSIEPINSNYYIEDLAKGKFTFRNPALKKLLKEKGIDNAATWNDILLHGGSVQHMEALSDNEKAVFQTFGEIPQIEIITQAADRQRYIDQAQSLNITIHPDAPVKDVNLLMIEAWKLGIKSLYYQRSTNPAQEFARSLLSCVACEA